MNTAYLLLGSNAGNRENLLQNAREEIAATCGAIVQQSSVYETAAWGMENQAIFLNEVVCIQTQLQPETLLTAIQSIEDKNGRQRKILWGPRTLDIDILFYNDEIIDLPHLTIPHPFLQKRRFTLEPIAEIAANMIHPVLQKSIAELLDECEDALEVTKYNL